MGMHLEGKSICRGEYLWEECDYYAFEDVFGY